MSDLNGDQNLNYEKEIDEIFEPETEGSQESDLEFDTFFDYEPPKERVTLFDVDTQTVIENRNAKPIDVIIAASKEGGVKIKEIKIDERGNYDTGCRKTRCNGRGYTGFESGFPIPCTCLFEKKDRGRHQFVPNRSYNRNVLKMEKKSLQTGKLDLARELGIKQIDSNTWVDSKKRKFKYIPGVFPKFERVPE